MNIDEWIAMAQEIAHNFEGKGKTDDMMRWLILCGYLHELKARRKNEEILQEYANKGWTFIDPDEMRWRIKKELDINNDDGTLPAFEAYEIIDKIMLGLKEKKHNCIKEKKERDCGNCKHYVLQNLIIGRYGSPDEKRYGCEKWECEFEPKGE